VQLAAYGAIDKAVAHAAQLSESGVGTFVTPIASGTAGTVWYRVLAGAYASHDAAASARRDFWRRKLAPRGQGDLLRAPYSLALAQPADLDRALAAGIPAVRWGKAGTGARILVGAFETSEQAALAHAQLKHIGVRATLVTRTGRTTP
jgi:cell division protein FtsN